MWLAASTGARYQGVAAVAAVAVALIGREEDWEAY
jgi:hypothetical protein